MRVEWDHKSKLESLSMKFGSNYARSISSALIAAHETRSRA